jgi:hypothetical protein
VDEWKRDLNGRPVETANELIVADGTDEAYEAFAALYASTPRGLQARDWLDRHRRMVAWKNAIIINTAAGYRTFLAQYPNSDLTATARKLEERLRNRPNTTVAIAAPVSVPVTNAALTCPSTSSRSHALKRSTRPRSQKKVVEPDPPKRAAVTPPKRRIVEDDVVVVRRPPPREVYEPSGPPVSIGIGIGLGGGGFGGGGGYGHRGGDGWQGRRGGY